MKKNNSNIKLTRQSEIDFVPWFRNAAPYINAFRNKIFVIYFSGDVLNDNEFPSLVHDVTLLNSLGVKLVLVHGARSQIEEKLKKNNIRSEYAHGLRITNTETMHVIKEASGSIRLNIEALFSTSLRYTPMAGSQINIISGNFVIAKPKGIIDGIDYLHTGDIRKIDSDSILRSLNAGDVILLSPVGYSPTGETFNVNGEDLATQSSIELKADKLIFIDDSQGIFNLNNQLINSLTTEQLKQIITDAKNSANQSEESDMMRHYQRIIKACEAGIKRVHIIDRNIDGSLLIELFTPNGIGTLITTDHLEDIRIANINDVNGIIDLINPLEEAGKLVKRSRERLEAEINNFYVIERESKIIGCAALYVAENGQQAELACMAIDQNYQSQGRGEKLFEHIYQQAQANKIKQIFILTTQATHWFREQGFSKVTMQELPNEKQAFYNYQRNSAVYIKNL